MAQRQHTSQLRPMTKPAPVSYGEYAADILGTGVSASAALNATPRVYGADEVRVWSGIPHRAVNKYGYNAKAFDFGDDRYDLRPHIETVLVVYPPDEMNCIFAPEILRSMADPQQLQPPHPEEKRMRFEEGENALDEFDRADLAAVVIVGAMGAQGARHGEGFVYRYAEVHLAQD